jgi:hypothetical protein
VPEIPKTAEVVETEPQGPVLSWRCLPARRSPGRTAGVVVFLLVLAVFINWYTHSPGFAVILTVVMFLSLSAYFFPAWYTLSDKGVRVKTLITTFEKPWDLYRSYWPDRNGVLLSPFPYKSRLENFRGLFVRFEGNRDEVLSFVKRYVSEPEPEE